MSQFKQKRTPSFVMCMGRGIALMLAVVFSLAAPAWAQTCGVRSVPSTPDSDFEDAGPGMVLHKPTGLIWKRCAEGQTWDGMTCTGEPTLFSWAGAFERVAAVNAAESESPAYPSWLTYLTRSIGGVAIPKPAEGAIQRLGKEDWRLPNINELLSIVETSCEGPAVNTRKFPGFRMHPIWSSSPVADSPENAWSLGVVAGLDIPSNLKNAAHQVRLVRGGKDLLNFYSADIPFMHTPVPEAAAETAQSRHLADFGLRTQFQFTELPDNDRDSGKLTFQTEPGVARGVAPVAVPSLETWGLGILSLLLCGMGMLATRRK